MLSEEMLTLGKKRFIIRDIFAYAQERMKEVGEDHVFDFSIGNPNAPVPKEVGEAIEEILHTMTDSQLHGYSNASGFEDVKQTLIDHINGTFDQTYTTNDIFLTCGAAAALTITMRALLNPADEVIILAPFYPEYPSFIQCGGGIPVIVPPNPDTMQIDFEALKKAICEKTKAIIVNSPNNPSGVVYSEETISKLASLLKEKSLQYGHTIYLISDEPYREILYDNITVPFIPDYYKETFICYSYSKSLSMPGHRIGYLLLPYKTEQIPSIRTAVSGAARILGFVQAPGPAQRIIQKCVNVRTNISLYRENRDLLYNNLTKMGFSCIKPQGAFYLLVKSPEKDTFQFVEHGKKYDLLYAPGEDFGCPEYVRLSFCIAQDKIIHSLPLFQQLADDYNLGEVSL
ncbi:MAG: pyridoxal phosphate-dependent aminotransferase [Lachnospiraceae bacterium]|nr:pyridoxal phosphate-dependent aminotransferase [Lachnospiraceae bacterium]